jgi:HSP20 family molecular chaperone IbpA
MSVVRHKQVNINFRVDPAPTKAMLKDSVLELELAKDAESKAVNVKGKTE